MKTAKRMSISEEWMQIAKSRGMTAQPAAARRAGKEVWKLLEDELAPVRQAAAFAIASVRDPAIVQAFILALKGASSARIGKATLTLGEAGFVNAAPYFAASFGKYDAKLNAALARALGMLADRSSASVLIEALDKNVVPAEAAEALGHLGIPDAAPSLLRALEHKKDRVRAAAAYSLGCLEGLGQDDEQRVMEKLIALGNDKSRRVRICAAVARFERGDADGLAAIRAALH
jgi:HEAT repeat protein